LDKTPDKINKLIQAAQSGDLASVQQLLSSGVDPDGPAKDGRTPLMAATEKGSLPVVEALLAAFADPTLGKGAETPLTIAYQKGKQDILKALFAASFQTLGNTVQGTVNDPRYSLSRVAQVNDEVPEDALEDLREVTTMLARVSGGISPTSAAAGGKYGNYTGTFNPDLLESKDSDYQREALVRSTMQDLVKRVNDAKDAVGVSH
jgi:ankyrin repeat protein